MDDEIITGHYRSRDLRRVSHGVFLPVRAGLTREQEWRRELAAWLVVLPDDAVLTHVTAARLSGWWLPGAAEWLPVFAAIPLERSAPRRAGLVVSRLSSRSGEEPLTVHGLPVDDPAEVLLRCARDLSLLDLVPLVESALRGGEVSLDALDRICHTRRPGVAALRRATAVADPRSESPWETLLRLFCWCLEVEVDVQPTLRDGDGHVIARADLRVRGTKTLLEYDGATHRTSQGQGSDLRRDRRLITGGHERLAFNASDLLTHPAVAGADLDRLLGREPDIRRLRRWTQLTAQSTYSETGRRRLLSRWSVPMAAFSA